MLNDSKLNQFFSRWQLSEEARAIINRIRASPPVRRVKGSGGNVVVRYTSHKMGVVIQAESYKNEFAAVYEFENDDEVLEFYDQPSRMKLTYRSANGRPVGVWHTPDYFVIGRDRAGWVECKTVEELEQLAQKMPNRYVPDGEQGWLANLGNNMPSRWACFTGSGRRLKPTGFFIVMPPFWMTTGGSIRPS